MSKIILCGDDNFVSTNLVLKITVTSEYKELIKNRLNWSDKK